MSKYSVTWCNTNDTRGGCVNVYAKNERDAVARARSIVNIGYEFRVLNVFARR